MIATRAMLPISQRNIAYFHTAAPLLASSPGPLSDAHMFQRLNADLTSRNNDQYNAATLLCTRVYAKEFDVSATEKDENVYVYDKCWT